MTSSIRSQSIRSLIEKYSSNPSLQHELAEMPMRNIDSLYKDVSLYLDKVNKALHTIMGARDLRRMKSIPKPFHVYKNGKILTKESHYNLAWLKVFFDYFRNPQNKVEGSYAGVFPEGTFKYAGKSYEFSLCTGIQEKELIDLFSLSLENISYKIRKYKFHENSDHKKLYKLRLDLYLGPETYKVVDKRPVAAT